MRTRHALHVLTVLLVALGPVAGPSRSEAQRSPATDHYPRFSPDGSRIAFYSGRTGGAELYTMALDGSDVRRVTDNDVHDQHPDWAPDGRRLAFFSYEDPAATADIFVIGVDGRARVRVTDHPDNDYTPSWSPNGERLVFYREADGRQTLLTMRADGSDERVIAPPNAYDPAWSPAGDRIAFAGHEGDNSRNPALFLVNPDGSGLEQITDLEGRQGGVNWSPDATRIVFESEHEGDSELYVMTLATRELRRLTHSPGDDRAASWSPRGDWIVFSSDRDGNREIYLIGVDGTTERRLTNG